MRGGQYSPENGGHFAPEWGGQFQPDCLVTLLRFWVVNLTGFSTQNHKLTTTGAWHKAKTYYFKRYTTRACIQCPVKAQCTKAKYGKGIQRSEYQAYVNQNKEKIEKNKDYYRKRQSIVEHPFGTIKRQWGFNYTITKTGMNRASADVGFMFIAYNLKRLINLLGIDQMRGLFYSILQFWYRNFTIYPRRTTIIQSGDCFN